MHSVRFSIAFETGSILARKVEPRRIRMSEEVHAELVGNVLRVEVAPGDQVGPGTALVIMESMKMEIPVHPEGSGTVESVAVAPGDVVSEGDLLVTLA
jgi:acetyl-CoA carboxylase biotin carboxyl carrier protein